MTTPTMDVLETIRKHAEDTDADFLRTTLQELLQLVMQAEVRAQIGADIHEHTPDRAFYPRSHAAVTVPAFASPSPARRVR